MGSAGGKSTKTAKNYAGAISGPISQWAIDNQLIQSPLAEIDTLLDFVSPIGTDEETSTNSSTITNLRSWDGSGKI